MAAFKSSFLVVAAFCLVYQLQLSHCTEFDVGERGGWAVPPTNDTDFYDNWASKKRFKVDDTIRFKYKKDSVMEVKKGDYKECNSSRPNFFSNTGNTIYTLNRSGFFYFISGSTGHCEMGQRMIVWVVAQDGSGGTSHHASNSNTLNVSFSFGLLLVIFVFPFIFSLA
ncbi:early nodulin-like protein 21 [Salvia miltiorrhiza]|uniref:early nodulin-like protein 21 n=1 Tax=Salvia miltiorrhiza TaxID=226208 RepID=UPI0025AC23B8|nr:early nodulin-like protein 21 [Salvia miltiorrhiza]